MRILFCMISFVFLTGCNSQLAEPHQPSLLAESTVERILQELQVTDNVDEEESSAAVFESSDPSMIDDDDCGCGSVSSLSTVVVGMSDFWDGVTAYRFANEVGEDGQPLPVSVSYMHSYALKVAVSELDIDFSRQLFLMVADERFDRVLVFDVSNGSHVIEVTRALPQLHWFSFKQASSVPMDVELQLLRTMNIYASTFVSSQEIIKFNDMPTISYEGWNFSQFTKDVNTGIWSFYGTRTDDGVFTDTHLTFYNSHQEQIAVYSISVGELEMNVGDYHRFELAAEYSGSALVYVSVVSAG